MKNEDLVKLIDLALVDGRLDGKERRQLIEHARQSGITQETLAKMIDARRAVMSAKGDLYPGVRRCPNCKAQIDDELLTACTYCNASLSHAVASNEFAEFHRRLMVTDGTKKVEMIKSYPLPTAKNDIVAFLSVAIPAYTTYSQHHRGILPIGAFLRFIGAQSKQDEAAYYEATAWKIKAMSTMSNARILHAADPAFSSIIKDFQSIIDAEVRAVRKRKIFGMAIAITAYILYYYLDSSDFYFALWNAQNDLEEMFEFDEPFVFLVWGVVISSVIRAIKIRSR